MNSKYSQSLKSFRSGFNSISSSPRIQNSKTSETDLNESIFEIYGIGYSYQDKIFGRPNGVGFMITESIAMTTNSIINDEEVASSSFAVFPSGQRIRFDPSQFFYTNRGLNFTVLTLKVEVQGFVDIRQKFKLRNSSKIFYFGAGIVKCEIIGIDSEIFSYTTSTSILPGSPIFRYKSKTRELVLQGIHHSIASAYSYSQGTRIDSIIQILCSVVLIPSESSDSPQNSLSRILQDYALQHKFELKKTDENFGEGRYLYWIEWLSKNFYKYDVSSEKWIKVKLANLTQFLTQETSKWKFNWGCRLIYLPDRSFLIVGGIGYDSGGSRADVYQFIPDREELYRKKSMLDRRDGPALIYRQGFVYAVGGRFTYTTCEKYNIKTNTWSYFSSMIHGRYEPVACLLQGDNYMYVAGGQPEESVGKTIERYSFSQDRWEGLQVVFQIPLLRCGIFPVTQTKFALLGGRYLKAVIIFEAVQEIIDGRTEEIFRVFEIEELNENIESVYPVVYNIGENKVYFTKSPENKAPSVLSYNFRSFLKPAGESVYVFKKNLKLPPLFAKRNLLNSKFPM